MIYTITLNPALDYMIKLPKLEIGQISQAASTLLLPGGKGLNVSMVLHLLGMPTKAISFKAGFIGEELERKVRDKGIQTDFITIDDGITRINVKIMSEEETAINGNGPTILEEHLKKLYQKLEKIQDEDVLVLSGSIPSSLPDNIYEQICKKVQKKKIKIVVDARKDLLKKVLPYMPFMIKPNIDELSELFYTNIRTDKEIATYACKLQQLGAKNVLVSLGERGAFLASEDGKHRFCQAPKGTRVNTVGAGDSMVAGFLTGYLQTEDFNQALLMGVSTGTATALSECLASKEDILRTKEKIERQSK